MFRALGSFSYRFRWIVIAVWVVLFALSVLATPKLAGALQGSFTNPSSPSQSASALVQDRFEQGRTQLLVVFQSDTLLATSKEFQAAEQKALGGLTAAGIPHLESVMSYAGTGNSQLISKDGKSSVAVLSFDASLQTVQTEVEDIRRSLRDTELTACVSGEAAVQADLSKHSFSDLQRVELFGLPVALIALLFVFGGLVAAALPVVAGGIAVTVALGGIYVAAHVTSMSIFSMNTASLLGLAVAIDYALFMVARFREELFNGTSVRDAVVTTTARAGRSVFYSGLAVVVGVTGLLFFPSPGLRSIGIGGALVVFLSVAASLTLMPALLGVLGHRVNSIRVIRLHPAHKSRFWNGWSKLVLGRAWASIIVALIIVGVLVSPALGMKTEMVTASTLPAGSEARVGLEILDEEFDREALSPTSVLLTWKGNEKIDLARAAGIFSYGQQLSQLSGVKSVISPFTSLGVSDPMALMAFWPQFEALLNDPDAFTVPGEGIAISGVTVSAAQLDQFKQLIKASVAPNAVLFRVVANEPPDSAGARQLVGSLTELAPPTGFQTHVAGEAAYSYDFFQELGTWFPWVVAWVFATSFLIFVVLLRSLLLPLLSVVVNALTIGVSYGLLVFFFQGTRFESILRFTSSGAVDAAIPIVLMCVLFGVTMDYAVFMLTRTHESWEETGDNRASVATGLVQTGRIIASAALLVVIVTGAFVFTSIRETKMLGMGMALAIIADTLLVRMTLLPAIMTYLGGANWWWPRKGAPGAREKQPAIDY